MLGLLALLGMLALASFSATASPPPMETSSCFSGDYKSFEAFYDSRQDPTKGKMDKVQAKRMRDSYDRWHRIDKERVECRFFTYIVDDIPVTGFFLKPRGVKNSELSPVVFNRGGNADRVFGTPYLYDKLAPFAEKGFFVIGSFYRGAQINGVKSSFRLTDQFGGDDVNDVLQLLPIIDSFDGLKGKQIGMWGVSRGGMMAFLAAKKSDRISAIVADSTPVDLVAEAATSDRMNLVFETWIPDFLKHKEAELKKRSVAYWHKEINNVPLLILHGSNDHRVSPIHILEFAKQLQLSAHPYKLIIYHSGGHGLRGFESEVNTEVANWLRKHVR